MSTPIELTESFTPKCRFDSSSKNPNNNVFFDPILNRLDLGYNYFKTITITAHCSNTSLVQTLQVSNNLLSSLPSPTLIPNMTELDCSYNRLQHIPFYPALINLYCSCNDELKSLSNYNASKLKKLFSSLNRQLDLSVYLPYLTELYLESCNLTQLNISFFPQLQLLDLANNTITHLADHHNIKELVIKNNSLTFLSNYPNATMIDCSHNQIKSITMSPSLIKLLANHNKLTILPSSTSLQYADVSFNKITNVGNQLAMMTLFINNNYKNVIMGSMPNLKELDVSFNCLHSLELTSHLDILNCQFNNLTSVPLLAIMKAQVVTVDKNTYDYIIKGSSRQWQVEKKTNNYILRKQLQLRFGNDLSLDVMMQLQHLILSEQYTVTKIVAMMKTADTTRANATQDNIVTKQAIDQVISQSMVFTLK